MSVRAADLDRVDMQQTDRPSQHGMGVLPFGLAIACLIVVSLNLRPGIVSVGPLLPGVQHQFGLSHTSLSLLVAIPDFLMGALALPSPWLARRLGRDRVILGALILLFVCTGARAMAPTPFILLLTTAGIGAGIAVTGALIASFVKASFLTRAGLAMGIYSACLGMGSTLAAGSTGPITDWAGDWRAGAAFWAIPAALAVAAWLIVERRGRALAGTAPAAARYAFPFAKPMVWFIGLYFACNNFLFYALLSWIVPIYTEQGASITQAGFVLAALAGGATLGSILFGILSRAADRRPYLAFCGSLVLAGVVMIGWAPAVPPLVSASIGALGIGGGFTLALLLPLDYTRDAEEAGVWSALVLTFGYLVATAGPILVGALRDATGSFSTAMWLLVGVAVVKCAVAPWLRPHRRLLI